MFVPKATILATVATLLAQSQAAAVDSRTPDGLKVVKVENHANGTLTWYADAGPVPRDEVSSRDAGCGTNTIKCSGSHAYDGDLCKQLFNSLQANLYMSSEPRAVCLGQGNDQCCISWSKTAKYSMRQKDILPSAQRVFSECGSSYYLSGQEWNVLLDGTCVSQCLSNRPSGCT